jgi:predicted  nucleic acid-binding Zn-ribbon protein
MLPAGVAGPIIAAITSPDMVAAAVALLAALFARLTTRLKQQQKEAQERLDRMSVHIVRAADAAESASEGVHNNHDQNLRDDLDSKFTATFQRMDALADAIVDLKDTVKDQSQRIRNLEGQIEGVRNDARTDRAHLYNEVTDLHDRIDRVKAVRKADQEAP